jgi:DNA-binding transcriptional ArsR family regulator
VLVTIEETSVMSKRPKKKEWTDPVLKELSDIKKLAIFFLLKTGVKAGDLAEIIEMDRGNFSRMIPKRKIKPYD